MNERIKELALQAMTYVTHNPKANKLNSGDMFDEKFAELIIRECAELAKNKACIIMQKAEEYAADQEEMISAASTAFQLEGVGLAIARYFGVSDIVDLHTHIANLEGEES